MASIARGNPARWWIGRSYGGASRAPHALLVGRLRRATSLTALTFLILILGGAWQLTNPQRLSRLSEVLLSQVLGGQVRVRTARLSQSGTLILSGVEVRPDDSRPTATSDIPIFAAEQVEARFDWFSLLSGQLSATQLVATTPVFHPIEELDTGHWNYERLRPGGMGSAKPRNGGKPGLSLPVVILRDAHVKWGQAHQGRVEQTAETVIAGQMTPDQTLTSTYHFQFSQLAPGTDMQTPLGGGAVGATLHGTWDSASNVFALSTENVVMSDALRNGLPRQAREWCEEHHLTGRLSQLNMTFSPADGLVLSVAFDDVSMMWMIAPEPGIAVGEDRTAYPLDVRNVKGKVVFALNQTTMKIIDLNGEVLGYHFIADCDVKGDNFDAPFNLKLRFPQANIGDRYPALFLAFITSQDLMQRVAPHGLMDIALDMRRTDPGGPLTFDGTIDCHDARMRFAHFPDPLDHVNGRITFDQKSVTFHDVQVKADLNTARISGSTSTVKANPFIDLTITSDNTSFDDRLAACLPMQFQEIWNAFSVRGHGGFVCKVTLASREAGQDLPAGRKVIVKVDVDLDDASGYIKAAPYYFSHATGRLHFEPDQTRIEHLVATTGDDGSGRMTLDGVVQHNGGDVSRLMPQLHLVGDVPLDAKLLHALPEDLTAKLRDAILSGRLAFDGTVLRKIETGAEPTLQLAGTVDWKQGTLTTHFGEQPVNLSGIAAQALLTPDAIDLKRFAAKLDWAGTGDEKVQNLAVTLAGKLATPAMTGELQFGITGTQVALPATAPAGFPSSFSDVWKSYLPSGRVDLDASAKIRVNMPTDNTAMPDLIRVSPAISMSTYRAGITLHDVVIKQPAWPAALAKLQGTVDVVPGRVTMTSMSGTLGNAMLEWQGQVMLQTGQVTLSGSAQSAGWPTQWITYLPESIVKYLDLKREVDTTSLALHLDSLTREATGMPWSYSGRIEGRNVATTGTLRTDTQLAQLVGKGTFTSTAGGPIFDFIGNLSATNMLVNDHMLETLTANVESQGARHTITISDIDGRVAGGKLQGKILIRTAGGLAVADTTQPSTTMPVGVDPAVGGGSYQADLVLHDAELSRILLPGHPTEEERKKVSSGRVTASLSLQESFGAQPDRTGRGELTVQDGNIYNVPLSMGLMQVVTLRLPVARSFKQAGMTYYLRNDEITFDRILLQSEGINLAGIGTISLADKSMDMSFVTESPHDVFIPIVSDIIRETRNELLQLSVTGTLDKPIVTPVPLSTISNVLRLILPHPRSSTTRR